MAANRKTYVKTQWVNDETPLDEEHLNNLEEGVEINNALAKENANYIDEIYAAFIEQTTLAFNSETNELTLSFGSTSGSNPTTRFNASFAVGLPVNIDIVNFAREIYTERHIEDLEISCPPITYGIAGGEAEIATGIQQLTVLYGNGTTGVKSAKVISRGKNQFAGFNEFIRVLSSEEYRIFTNLPSGLLITSYNSDKEQSAGEYNEYSIGTDCIISGYENQNAEEMWNETTSYIKLAPANPTEVTEDTEVMMYLTFGESYSEEYEKPRTDEIVLPNITLRSVGEVRDEIYAEGGGIRRISDQGEILQSPTVISDVENPGWDPELFVDNYGTILFLDENDEEIEIEQPYQIIYKISLAEFLDSAYVKAKGNASDIALVSEIEDGDVVAGQAENIHTERTIDDLDVSCPPITYGIAGGDAEIETAEQELETLFGNTIYDEENEEFKSAKTAKVISRGKNQFIPLNNNESDYIDVIEGEEYRFFQENGNGIDIIFFDKNKDDSFSSQLVQPDDVTFTIPEGCRYIKIIGTHSTELGTNIMLYNTFGESYNELYEESYTSEIELPNIELRSIGNVRDEIYSAGGGKRKVKLVKLGDLHWVPTGDLQPASFKAEDFKGIIKAPLSEEIPNAKLSENGFHIYLSELIYAEPGAQPTPGSFAVGSDGTLYFTPDFIDEDSFLSDEYFLNTQFLFEINEEEITTEENPGWDPKILIDNYGTIMFVDENDEEVEVEQPYQILYKVNLKEFLDSAFVKAAGDGSDIALISELENGDVVPAKSTESESIEPYGPNSGINQRTSWLFQTTAGGSDCGDEATLQKIFGRSLYFFNNYFGYSSGDETNIRYSGSFSKVWNSGKLFMRNNATPSQSLQLYPERFLQEKLNGFNSSGGYNHKHLMILEINDINDIYTSSYVGGTDENPIYGKILINGNEVQNGQKIYFFYDGTSSSRLTISCSTPITQFSDDNEQLSFSIKGKIIDLTHCFGRYNEPLSIQDIEQIIPFETFLELSENYENNFYSVQPRTLKTTGYNQNDEQYLDEKFLDSADGSVDDDENWMCSANFLRIKENTEYEIYAEYVNTIYVLFYDKNEEMIDEYEISSDHIASFVTPEDSYYAKFSFEKPESKNFKICLFIAWDYSKETYEPHEEHIYNIPTGLLLKSIDDVKDELTPDGFVLEHITQGLQGTIMNDTVQQVETVNNDLWFKYTIRYERLNQDHSRFYKIKFIDPRISEVYYAKDGIEFVTSVPESEIDWRSAILYEISNPGYVTTPRFSNLLLINDFGTMEFTESNNLIIESEITYIGDYVAFIDTLAVKTQYDADEVVLRSDSEIKEKHDDKNFIQGIDAKIYDDVGKIICVEHKHRETCGIGTTTPIQTTRQNGRVVAKWRQFYGTKFCNIIPNAVTELKEYFGDLETFMEYNVEYDNWERSVYPIKLEDYYEMPDLIKKYIHFKDLDGYRQLIFIKCSGCQKNTVGDYYEMTIDGTDKVPIYNVFGSLPMIPIDNAKRFTFKPVYKRLFKFIKNFDYIFVDQTGRGNGWTGVMANMGIEVSFYCAVDWETEEVWEIAIPKVIPLDGSHKYETEFDKLFLENLKKESE